LTPLDAFRGKEILIAIEILRQIIEYAQCKLASVDETICAVLKCCGCQVVAKPDPILIKFIWLDSFFAYSQKLYQSAIW
jgi:hypothetical protein